MGLYHVYNFKVLGALCLIDQGELDWKLLVVDQAFSKEMGIRTIEQYKQQNPAALEEIMEWLRKIKTYDGKPANWFDYDDQVLSVEKTIEIISENHQAYKDLLAGKVDNSSKLNLERQNI
uniref:inorganic diphosphatase n=1 Tax=Strombidium rassoulzadegani TaxID=1082188 RepID=A0A7S3CMW9_9SPIT|mmetsp:Transcript_17919/g.30480  ORF Transcript_17919/g.30480 Transcript_17919/m.30480 type:complete len:120 (+) Transcript_17919:576-935(+)